MKIIEFFSICFLLLSLAQFNIKAENFKANVQEKSLEKTMFPLLERMFPFHPSKEAQ